MNGSNRRLLSFAASVGVLALATASPATAQPNAGSWASTGSETTGVTEVQTALLQNGDALFAGGETYSSGTLTPITAAQIYNPKTGTFSAVAPMNTATTDAAVVTLPNGNVLVAGGSSSENVNSALDTAEVYDPTTNTWTNATNDMSDPRALYPTATVLADGKVLVAGGFNSSDDPVASADLYDPSTNSFTPTTPMEIDSTPEPLGGATATLLGNGNVLVAGGETTGSDPVDTGLVYDPSTSAWSEVANSMSSARALGNAERLPDGNVLEVGGISSESPSPASAGTTDIYNPSTNRFSAGPSLPNAAPALGGSSTLPNGDVLEFGGIQYIASAVQIDTENDVYDPTTNSWSAAGAFPLTGVGFGYVGLPNGQVVAAGGDAIGGGTEDQAFLFSPSTAPGAPQSVTATAGNGSALVQFTPPTSDGGSAIEHYTIKASTGQTAATPDGRTWATVNGLKNGTKVTFTVTATNVIGTSAASAASVAVTPQATGPAPKLKLSGLKSKLKLKAFLKGLKFKVTPNQAVSLKISLLGHLSKATIAAASYNLTLASTTKGQSASARTITLKPSKKLVGKPRKAKVELLVSATDAAGKSTTVTKTISIQG